MAKEIKLKISLDGADGVEKEIDDIGSGLDAMAKQDAKAAKDALTNLDRSTLSNLKSQIKSIGETLKSAGEQIKNFGSQVTSLGTSLTLAVSAPITALATLGVKFNAMKEQALVSFGVLLKSGEKAKDLFGELTKFAADTPFEMPELQTATKSLLAFGIAQEKILPTLKNLGDISAGIGAPITDLASLYGKAKVQGRLFAEDVNQLTERGIPVIQEFAKQFGVTDDKVKKLVEDGKIGFPQLEKAITDLTAEGGLFFGMMDAQSKTFSGRLSTMMDTINTSLGEITEPLFNALSAALPYVISFIQTISDGFTGLSPTMQIVISIFAGIAAAIGPVLVVLGSVIVAIGTVVSAIGTIAGALAGVSIAPIIAAVAAGAAVMIAQFVAIAAAVTALYLAWQNDFGGIRTFTLEVFAGIKSFIQTAMQEISAYVSTILAGIYAFWEKNGDDIMKAVNTVYSTIADIVKDYLDSLRNFWELNGEAITALIRSAWEGIKTVVTAGVNIVLNVIKLVAAVINGDWAAAWEAAKTIVKTVLMAIQDTVVSAGAAIVNKAIEIGMDLVRGLINGMSSLKDKVISTATEIITAPLNVFRSIPIIRSPSKVTTEIGEFLSEGLAVGMENKLDRVKDSSKKVANEAIKNLREALKEFEKLAGASPGTVQTIQQTNNVQSATSAQSEIIKLRAELGRNQYKPLPSTVGETERELAFLKQQKQAIEEVNKEYETWYQTQTDIKDLQEKQQIAFDEKLEGMRQSGALELLNLEEQINLTGVIDERERQRIQNNYEILRLRETMKNDGYGEQMIDEAAEVLRMEQARVREGLRILDIRKQVAEASSLEQNLLSQLADLQNGNRELSEYEKTLQKINTVLKDISPQQKENLLILAQQIDAQKAYNEAFNQTYDFIRNTFDILTDSSTSFKDKLKEVFGGIFSSFKKMLLDMAAAWLTSKIFGSQNGGGQSSSGGFLQTILGGLGIGGGGATPPFFPGGSGGSSGSFSLQCAGSAFGGLNLNSDNPFGQSNGGKAGGSSNALAIAGLIGTGANILGGLIGGKAGSVISSVGSGISTGAMIGSIIPGLGTIAGAVIGGAIGFFSSIFGSKKRKIDKEENLPQLQKGFADALAQLRALGADKNAFLSDPEGVLAKAMELRSQIASGFGLNFQSKKYRQISQQQIATRLGEADRIIAGIRAESDRATAAKNIDDRLNANFATGAYMSPEFLKQYGNFKRRNGILPGAFTGRDKLPSMLAEGEMVLNPKQILSVIRNAGGNDVFKGAGIPGYRDGAFIQPNAPGSRPVSSGFANNKTIIIQPNITVLLEGEGISNVRIKEVLMDGIKNDDEVKVELVSSYDKTKRRTK